MLLGNAAQLVDQWFGFQISLTDSFSCLKRFSLRVVTKFKDIKSVEDVDLDLKSIESKSAKAIVF